MKYLTVFILISAAPQLSAQTKTPQLNNPLPSKSNVRNGSSSVKLLKKNVSFDFDKTDYSYRFRFKGTTISTDNFFLFLAKELKIGQKDNYTFIRTDEDDLGFKHHRYQQTYDDIPVEGVQFILHEKDGIVKSANGKFIDGLNLSMSLGKKFMILCRTSLANTRNQSS